MVRCLPSIRSKTSSHDVKRPGMSKNRSVCPVGAVSTTSRSMSRARSGTPASLDDATATDGSSPEGSRSSARRRKAITSSIPGRDICKTRAMSLSSKKVPRRTISRIVSAWRDRKSSVFSSASSVSTASLPPWPARSPVSTTRGSPPHEETSGNRSPSECAGSMDSRSTRSSRLRSRA